MIGKVNYGEGRHKPPRWAIVLGLLLLPVILGAWGDVSGNTINPRYVAKIKDGQTTKHEILLYFGDPKEVERTSEGTVFKYYSYVDAPPLAMKSPYDREINPQSAQNYVLSDEHKIKKVKPKTESTVLRSTLTIYFKPDGQTVLRHEYKEEKQ